MNVIEVQGKDQTCFEVLLQGLLWRHQIIAWSNKSVGTARISTQNDPTRSKGVLTMTMQWTHIAEISTFLSPSAPSQPKKPNFLSGTPCNFLLPQPLYYEDVTTKPLSQMLQNLEGLFGWYSAFRRRMLLFWHNCLNWTEAASLFRFWDHTPSRHATCCRTPLHEGSARHRDLYLTKHNIYKKQPSMPQALIEPAILACECPQTQTLESVAWTFTNTSKQQIV
jgi:hypothetical protein